MAGCCGSKKALPSIRKQASDLALTAANVIANAARTGQVTAEANLVEQRVKICQECRHLQSTRCTLCGCFITVKVALAVAHCPIRRW